MFFGNALIVGEWELVAWGRKSYSGPAEIASFSSLDFSETISMTHSDMLYQLNICKFYFYESFLYQIFVPWKFMKLRSFIFKFDLNVKKKLFSSRIFFFFEDCLKVFELHVVDTWGHMQSWVDEITRVIIQSTL